MTREALLSALAGLIALGVCAAGLWRSPAQAAGGYLAACVFWLGLSLGSMGLLLVLVLLGGSWGAALRPALRAAAAALPLLPPLFLPLLPRLPVLYPWLRADALAQDPVLREQSSYLNLPGFLLRAALCFAAWLWLSRRLRAAAVSRRAAVCGSLLLWLSTTVFAVDWIMSLQPEFNSSSFGLTVAVSQLLGAAALALLARGRRLPAAAAGDFGGLLLTLALAWAYLEFMSYLTVWSADLPAETGWYLPRTRTGWKWTALGMLLLQAVLPIALLLSGRFRRSRTLPWLGAGILAGNAAEAAWRVLPALHPGGLRYGLYEASALAGIGGVWLALFLRRLGAEAAHG